jgi:hypothetical protein
MPHLPDSRWLLDREDTPWYPTMRLWRQDRPGEWAPVFARMAAELARVVASTAPAIPWGGAGDAAARGAVALAPVQYA